VPERFRGVSTPATDPWAFGATLYAAVSGRADSPGLDDQFGRCLWE
jgi:hypothetical protein